MADCHWHFYWLCHEVCEAALEVILLVCVLIDHTNRSYSSKWTGILMVPFIWILVCTDVWSKLCEKHNQVHVVLKQVCLYAVTVGLLPFIVYCSIFKFHFSLLPLAGDHDLLISARLRYSLEGNALEPSQPSKRAFFKILNNEQRLTGLHLLSHCLWFSNCYSTRWLGRWISSFSQKEINRW